MVKGLKIDNKQSSISAPTKPAITKQFEERAEEVFNKTEGYKERIWSAATQFKTMIEDKTLADNKGPISVNVEKEVLEKLIAVASDMDTDEDQPYGVGSNALCMLLLKMMLLQRNKINELSYQLSKMSNVPK